MLNIIYNNPLNLAPQLDLLLLSVSLFVLLLPKTKLDQMKPGTKQQKAG